MKTPWAIASNRWIPVPCASQIDGKRNAFTLIEMLIVIAIIAILAGLLFPAISKVKEQSKRIQCVSNLRNIGLALHLYANEWGQYPPMADDMTAANPGPPNWGYGMIHCQDGIYAEKSAWYVRTGLYPKFLSDPRVFYCPGQYAFTYAVQSPGACWANYLGYMFFCNMQGTMPTWGPPIGDPDGDRTTGAATTATCVSKSPGHNPGAVLAMDMSYWGANGNGKAGIAHTYRGFMGANKLYSDCHVKWCPDDRGAQKEFIFYTPGSWVW